MPADRFFHARLGHSAKVSSLSDLEYRVWTTYVLAADDFGVMRADAVAFQAAHDALRAQSVEEIVQGVERLVTVGLVATFVHQAAHYLYQADWQDFQRVRYPGRTLQPVAGVGGGERADASPVVHPSGRHESARAAEVVRHTSGTTSEILPHNCGSPAAELRQCFRTRVPPV